MMSINFQSSLSNAQLMFQMGNFSGAKIILEGLYQQRKKELTVINLLAYTYLQLNLLELGIEFLSKSLDINRLQPTVLLNLGAAFLNSENYEDARKYLELSVKLDPKSTISLYNLAIALNRLGRLEDSLNSLNKLLKIQPNNYLALNDKVAVLFKLKQYDEALEFSKKILILNPDYAEAYFNLGLIYHEINNLSEAIVAYKQATDLKDDYEDAFKALAEIYAEEKRNQEAIDSCLKVIAINPGNAEVLYFLGNLYAEEGQIDEALNSFSKAIYYKPEFPEAYHNAGILLQKIGKFDQSINALERAIELKSDFAESLVGQAMNYSALKKPKESIDCLERCLEIDPDRNSIQGFLLQEKKTICDWNNYNHDAALLKSSVINGKVCTPPFPLLSLFDEPKLHKAYAEIYVNEKHQPTPPVIFSSDKKERIRLGYFSSDFGNHPVSFFIGDILKNHDKTKFELIGFSLKPHNGDEFDKIKAYFDEFIIVDPTKSDQQVASLAREMEIDIAIDLNGHTAGSRPGIFAEHAAPIQINYLGYPGTSGATYFDYIVADATIIPLVDDDNYCEKIIYMPDSFWVTDLNQNMPGTSLSRAEAGLPESGFIFCCFNALYKINPDFFSLWMEILKEVPSSYLWLHTHGSKDAKINLSRAAEKAGIDKSRLIFAQRVNEKSDHLARLRLADLFLDTSPYNAHTTASDFLRMGVPLLTKIGASFASRVSASLLHSLGIEELITSSMDQYKQLAIDLASNPIHLEEIKKRMRERRHSASIYDVEGYVKNLELAYIEANQKWLAGLPTDHITLTSK